jgi:hypothetical protein
VHCIGHRITPSLTMAPEEIWPCSNITNCQQNAGLTKDLISAYG